MRKKALVAVLAIMAVVGVGGVLVVSSIPELRYWNACDDERCPPDAPWVYPVAAEVSSAFRSKARPDHHGADYVVPPGTPVVAASSGVVTISECQARLGDEPYSCDQDGSWEVRGCGWFVKVLHAHRTATLYCHLQQQPEVEVGDVVVAGDLLGYVGSSGNSSGPHLHLEVQVGSRFVPPVSTNAVDPEPFLADRVDALANGINVG